MRSGIVTLYMDTSSSALYTGIVKEGTLIAEKKEELGKDLSTYALYRIEEMLKEANLTPEVINQIIVVNGPGSYTGVRIGVTIAKVFAWAKKLEIIPISSLEAMAISSSFDGLKVPYLDARRGYAFAGIYDKENKPILCNQYISFSKLKEIVESKNTPYEWISNDSLEEATKKYNPDILRIVMSCQNKKSVNPHMVNPIYLKRTEAEENKGIEVS